MSKQTLLTKSRYITGLNCEKALWLMFNRPEDIPEIDEAAQHRFDEGHKIGELAKSLFPGGVNIEEIMPVENYKKSKELLKKRKPLFEAGFIHENGKCYARADILLPVEKDEWDIIEVKSATSVKEDYLEDISFQKYCYESAGLKIRKCYVLHINNQYVLEGEIKPAEFFVLAEVTEYIATIMSEVSHKIQRLFTIIAQKECPEMTVGNYCEDPYGVHKTDKFWQEHPECDIFDLYRGGKRAVEWFNAGILEIRHLNDSHKLNGKQKIQHKTHTNGEHHYDRNELGSFLKNLEYPLYLMDFETYNTAIPLYNGLKPYQQIPFQFSVHVIKKKGEQPKHYSFIAEGAEDPRPKFIEELKKALGIKGNVIVYNQSFEQARLKELGEYFPKYAE